jgi:chorismate synthase
MPLRLLTAGESHGPEVLAILEGLPAGLALSADDINPDLARRQGLSREGKPYPGASARMKIERDAVEITGGVMAGHTIGAPLALRVLNLDHAKWKGRAIEPMTIPRPGHADLTGATKYGYRDLRLALERASARETTARVAAGAACRKLLLEFGVRVGSYVTEIGSVGSSLDGMTVEDRLARADGSEFRCPDPAAAAAMADHIRETMQAKDTLGGVFEVVALGVPPGLGSHVHWDRRLTGRLAAAVMSIHAIKGVEIGDGFANARRPGTQVHDEIFLEDGRLVRHTNRAGGLEGGITTGQPIVVRAAMKPLSTTLKPMRSVNLATGQPEPMAYERSDFCAVPRACSVGEAMACLVLADALLEKIGGDSLAEMKPRFESLRKARLDDLGMEGAPIEFWP